MDDSDNGDDPTTDNGEGDHDDPTPLVFADIHMAKFISENNPLMPSASGIQGNFDVTYEFVVKSTGNDTLENITMIDDIAAQYGGAYVGIVTPPTLIATNASSVGMVNAAYSPGGNIDLLSIGSNWILGPCDTIHLSIVIEVDPDAVGAVYGLDGQLLNQATAGGLGQDTGDDVSDDSDNGNDPNGTNGDDEEDDPTPLQIPLINLAKDIAGFNPAASGILGNIDVTFDLTLENTGTVNLSDLTLIDDIALQFGSTFVEMIGIPQIIATTANLDPTINPAFTGAAPALDMFLGGGNIDPNQSITVRIVVELDPNAAGAPDPLENQATSSGQTPSGETVEDASDSGSDPEGDNPGEPGDEGTPDDPTAIRLPQLSLVKSLVGYSAPASGIAGHVDIIMDLDLKNIGNVELKSLNLNDVLDDPANFGIWYVGMAPGTMPTITVSDATADPVLDPAYDGFTVGNNNMFDGMSGCLDVNQHVSVQIVLELDATIPGIPDTLYNLASVEGTYTDPNDGSTTTVDDDSDSGTEHESTNPDAPGDLGTPDDPTPIPLLGCIGNMVWYDCNGNGLMDAGEEPLVDVLVLLKDEEGNTVMATTTDDAGKYLFEFIIPDNYYLEFIASEGFEFTFADEGNDDNIDSDVTGFFGPGTTDLTYIAPGTQCGDNDFWDAGLYECVPIGDLVWYDNDEDDIWDFTENGINGIRVNLYRQVNGGTDFELWDYDFTDHKPGTPSDDGWYKFCAPPGTYYLEIGSILNGLVAAQEDIGSDEEIDSDITNEFGPNTTDAFTVACQTEKCDLGAGFYLMATAGDFVWRDDNGNGQQENWEPRMEGVTIQAFDITGDMIAEVVTDNQGSYEIDYLQKENYYFKVIPPLGMGATVSNNGNDSTDSDVDHSNGSNTTANYLMAPGEHIPSIDVGLLFGVVPVEFTDFGGEHRADHNFIHWTTAMEVNNEKFELERRLDDGEFVKIATIEGAGTLQSESKYNYEDHDVDQSGVYYYRLRQMDYDGNNSTSGTIAIRVDKSTDKKSVAIYPNPAIDDVQISLTGLDESNTEITLSIFDISGRLVKTETIELTNDVSRITHDINIVDLVEGIYTVKIDDGSQIHETRLIKLLD